MTEAPRVPRKWRPPLALVVYAVLLAVLALPSGLIVLARLMEMGGQGLTALETGMLLASLLLTLVIAYVLTRAVTRPIAALIQRTQEISQGGRQAIQPLGAYGTLELATLTQSFLDLASRLMDRTEYMRSFAAHVSHELKSPLTTIKGSAELMRDEGAAMSEAERQRFLDHIVTDADRLTRLVARLRELAQAEMPLASGSTTLGAVLSELAAQAPALRLHVEGGEVAMAIPAEALGIALGHLVENSMQHGASEVRLSAVRVGQVVELTAADDGEGISEGNRDRVFQPFFTTRRESGGTGMGLDITRALLRAHDADIALVAAERGASFRITVPAAG